MYPRGGDRGWHRGHDHHYHHPRDVHPVPALRGHHPRPYRGGYHVNREHGSYGAGMYHDYHDNPCHDRSYSEGQYMDYEEPPYHGEDRSYPEYREPGYHRGGRHDGGYQKRAYHRGGGYSHPRGGVYHKKHKSKIGKTNKDNEKTGKTKPETENSSPKVVHNPARSVVVLTTGEISEFIFHFSQQDECEKIMSPKSKSQKQASVKPVLEVRTDDTTKDSIVPECDIKQECTEMIDTQPVCETKSEPSIEPKEEILPVTLTPKKEESPVLSSALKRPHSEEMDHSFHEDQREGETSMGKRVRSERITDSSEEGVQIPLLDGWTDQIASHSPLRTCASKQETTALEVRQNLSPRGQALRTAFILAKKEEIELSYARDCRTFALVANMLLRKDSSIEAAVKSALRSSLQEIAGRYVDELTSFIESYDLESSAFLNISSKLQDMD
ncbi:uncharacterized protein WCC33_000955 [Rhinophrynus dorsalis]